MLLPFCALFCGSLLTTTLRKYPLLPRKLTWSFHSSIDVAGFAHTSGELLLFFVSEVQAVCKDT